MGNIRKIVELRTIDADNLRKACIDFSWCDCTSGEYEELFDNYTNVNIFCRTLSPDLINEVVTMLKENFGRVINIEVEIPYHNGEIVPVSL